MNEPADLAPARVLSRLQTLRYGRELTVLPVTDSTMDDAVELAAAGAEDGHVVVADTQRSGRGSKGRSWSSPPGSDLYLSIVARPGVPIAALPPLTLAVGLGVADTVDEIGELADPPVSSLVKWPNDVWIRDRKTAGILVEASSSGGDLSTLIIGIGLNVNRRSWPADIAGTATSLGMACGTDRLDRADVLAALLGHVERWADIFASEGSGSIVRALTPRLALKSTRVSCGEVVGTLQGVSETGAVRIETTGGLRECVAGQLLPA